MVQVSPVVSMAAFALLVAGCASAPEPAVEGTAWERMARRHVGAVLDALHTRASNAEFEKYFALFAPDAVFLGTDATERWTVEEFKAYTRPYFESGRGWTYGLLGRHVELSGDGRVAWFDERLANAKYGECRGTGVLVRERGGAWKIAQYSLTKPIPNDRMEAVIGAIGAGE